MTGINQQEFEQALSVCASEPIHQIGSVQPHGALLVISADSSRRILQATTNIPNFLDLPADGACDKSLAELIDDSGVQQVEQLIQIAKNNNVATGKVSVTNNQIRVILQAHLYISEGMYVLELEADQELHQEDRLVRLLLELQQTLPEVGAYTEITQYLSQITKIVRDLTDFDSVMVYRFDSNWDGEVIAQSHVETAPSYLGLRFPASDIPTQARQLYLKNLVRLVADVDAPPVPVLPILNPVSQKPLDMTHSALRSLSPIHMEYLRNIGVQASMVISLLQNGQLWGLITCHHMSPKRVSISMREVAIFVSRIVSSSLASLEVQEHRNKFFKAQQIVARLLRCIATDGAHAILKWLLPDLQNLLDATGMVMVVNDEVLTYGEVMESDQIDTLLTWLRQNRKEELFFCDQLSKQFAPASNYPQIAAGVLMIPLLSNDCILWLRKEKHRTIKWAGNYEEGFIKNSAGDYRLTPRKSFEIWKESWLGISSPWARDETEVALFLAKAIIDGLAQKIIKERNERLLADNEKKLRLFLEHVPACLAMFDTEMRYLAVSNRWKQDYNLGIHNIIGLSHYEIFPEIPERWKEVHRRALSGEVIIANEDVFQRLDGSVKWLRWEVRPWTTTDGNIGGILIFSEDITEQKKIEEVQNFLARTASKQAEKSFFEQLARYLSECLDMFYVCIDRLEGDGLNARTLAIWCDGHFEDNVTYALKDTPCGDVVGNQICCFPTSVCQLFPHDQVLQNLCAECYIGVSLYSHAGQPIGLIAVIGRVPLENRPMAESILKLVAIRASAELERLFAEEKLQLSASVFTHAREGIMITDSAGTIIEVNDALICETGYSREEMIGQNPRIFSSGRQSKDFYASLWQDLIEHGDWSGEMWNRRKDGDVYAVMETISAVHDAQGLVKHYVALCSDITPLKEHERQLEHIAHFDALTNLPNRVLLADRMHQAMSQTHRHGRLLAVIYLDLDGFKAVNDQFGHEIGDHLLKIVSNRLKQVLREGDTIARLGGDEFVTVMVDLENVAACIPLLSRLLDAAAQTVQVGELDLKISASLGVTFYPQTENVDADQLLRQSDQAMYQAKLAGKNSYHFFDVTQDISIRGFHESLARISRALIEHELLLYYQPKVNMRTGTVIGAEALIRWQHPEKGLLPPAAFLPIIENHSLAIEIGEWVIKSALTQMEIWHEAGLDIPVSVNVCARQLQQTNFVNRLREILAQHPGIMPSCLELEVLETSALEEIDKITKIIEECREIGVRFALDDFGTGYSSLTYLKFLPVAVLKIDQSFVRNMLEDPDDLAILQGVLGLASAFRRKVIAEGVETVNQGEMLLQLGCEFAQGFGIARPMPADEIPSWAANWCANSSWVDLSPVSNADLPLLFASVEHRAWVAALRKHINSEASTPPAMHKHICNLCSWWENSGRSRFGAKTTFQSFEPLHNEIHISADRMQELHANDRHSEALQVLDEIHNLQDGLLELLKLMEQEIR